MKQKKRTRLPVNVTLSDVARVEGLALAEARGMKLSQLVEQLLRAELKKAGKLPSDSVE